MLFPKLKKDNSLSGIVYQAIYKQILAGKLKPGEKITEAGISNSMEISRAPVREALKRLAEDHLVTLVPRRGCFVSELNANEIEEIYEIRKRLECMALEYAFEKFDLRAIKELRKKFMDCKKKSGAQFVKSEIQLDSQLHNLISRSSGCPNLQEMLEKLRARVQMFRVREADYLERAQDAWKEHIRILDMIIASDKKNTIKSMAMHIEHTCKNVLTKFMVQPHDIGRFSCSP